MFNEANIRSQLKVQNIVVPNADYIVLYFNNETFWVNRINENTPVNQSRDVASFGAGFIETIALEMPKGTKKQFMANSSDFDTTGEIAVLIEGNSAFGGFLYLVSISGLFYINI